MGILLPPSPTLSWHILGEPVPQQNILTKLKWDIHTSPPHPPAVTTMCCHCPAAFGEEWGGGGWDEHHPQWHKFTVEHGHWRWEEGQWHDQGGIGTVRTGQTGSSKQDHAKDGSHGHANNAGLAAAAAVAAATTIKAIPIPKPTVAEPEPWEDSKESNGGCRGLPPPSPS